MSKSRLEWKVGLFVFIGLALLAGLLLEFSKGLSLFRPTYQISVSAVNVGGLKTRATVLMSGVQVGTVADIQLSPAGTNVFITLRLYKQYEIHTNANFIIDQSGFLGDQFVAIEAKENQGPIFHDGDKAEAQRPFNLQEFTRSATGFITRIDDTVKKLDEALANVTRLALNPETLTNIAEVVVNLRGFSERALVLTDDVQGLLATNGPAISQSVSNLVAFSEQLNHFSDGLNGVLATNREAIQVAINNIESSSETLKSLLGNVQAGKGVVGDLLQNEQFATNVSQIALNLSITSSNLNRLGLWGILWRHNPPKPAEPPAGQLKSPKESSE